VKILVTGGAGYIGSVCVEQLIKKGHDVIIVDDLREGHREAVLPEAKFHEGNYGDKAVLEEIFKKNMPEAVIHFAAETLVEFSMTDPARYFINNILNGLTLLEVMRKYNCVKMIFSSTAATFGEPEYIPIDEKHPQKPINAYGESKLMFEKILDWYNKCYGLKFNVFRYFNAAGASERLGEDHDPETHLIPLVIKTALGKRKKLEIYGSDYPTKDGTCVRDYIHVVDLADAHILALDNLNKRSSAKYNLGNGEGFTNQEVVRMVEKISGKNIEFKFSGRRAGDPAKLVASSELAKTELNWNPKYDSLESIVSTAWDWHRRNPDGY